MQRVVLFYSGLCNAPKTNGGSLGKLVRSKHVEKMLDCCAVQIERE